MPHILDDYDGSLPPADIINVEPAAEVVETSKAKEMAAMQLPQKTGDVKCVEHVTAVSTVDVRVDGANEDGAGCKSRPPSPPESGLGTPTLRIAPCPFRLRPFFPPVNFGSTNDRGIYRSAFPLERNLDFLNLLGLQSVLCLVDTEPTEAYSKWIVDHKVQRHRVDISPNKDGKVKTTADSICEALVIVGDSAKHPIYIHCNQGKHRTGCVIACWRKVQGWDIEDIIAEYQAYAYPKARPGDIEFIRGFDAGAFTEYLKRTGRYADEAYVKRLENAIASIEALGEAVSEESSNESTVTSLTSTGSTLSDEELEASPTKPSPDMSALASSTLPMLHRLPSRPSPPPLSDDGKPINDTAPVQAAKPSDTACVNPALLNLNSDNVATSVVELAEDTLTPPAEPCTKMLGTT